MCALLLFRPILGGHRPQRCVIDAINATRPEDDVPLEFWKMPDIEARALAAHQIYKVLLVWIGEVMRNARRSEAHKVAGADLIDRAIDLRTAAAG
jgi:hypothetical protein